MIAARRHNGTPTAQSIAVTALVLAAALLALPSIAQAESCPNEQLRAENRSTSLPDCRAYELVTPPFKYGQPPSVANAGIAPDGSAVSYASIGAFNGAEGSAQEGGQYVARRLSGGWQSTPVNPSNAEFRGGVFFDRGGEETNDFNFDLTATLFAQARLGANVVDGRIYVRQVTGGAVQEVGSVFSPETVASWIPKTAGGAEEYFADYKGASADFSHVLFSIQPVSTRWIWPGDASVLGESESLYEYVGTAQTEPELVGVSNQEPLATAAAAEHKEHINEAAHLISDCGVELGGPFEADGGPKRHAISNDGATIFFTPAPCRQQAKHAPSVDELYARVDRARTVAISEPTPADCAACDTSEGIRRNATFQGASTNGERAFFFSEQALLPDAAGNNLYEYDFAGSEGRRLTLIAPSLAESDAEPPARPGGVVNVSDDGSHVYFVSQAVLAPDLDARGEPAVEGADNLYAYDTNTRQMAFVATLSPEDSRDWEANEALRNPESTPDGQYLLFPSVNDLTPDAAAEGNQLYRYEAATAGHPDGQLVRVSVGDEGFNDDGNAVAPPGSLFAPTYSFKGQANPALVSARTHPVRITDDGERVFFSSPLALTPTAVNYACALELPFGCAAAAENVYEWDNGRVYLISDGRDTGSVFRQSATQLVGASPSGSDVFFTSGNALLPEDTDTQIDLYDAREDGGFPAQATATPCDGEGCRNAPPAPPGPASPGSATTNGPGNVEPVSASTPPRTVGKGRTRPLTRAQKLARALRACKKKPKRSRSSCEKSARKKYGKASPSVPKRKK
jgi:Tol biopolymer transport system component